MARPFQYPNLCARCASAQPTAVWTLQHVHSARGAAATVHTFQYLNLPVCSACRKSVTTGVLLSALVSGILGASVFFPLWRVLERQGLPAPWVAVAVAAFAGLVVFTGGFFVVKGIAAPEFARLGPGATTVVFDNPEYQRHFDALNPPPRAGWRPGRGPASDVI
jgi:hypothetical protein